MVRHQDFAIPRQWPYIPALEDQKVSIDPLAIFKLDHYDLLDVVADANMYLSFSCHIPLLSRRVRHRRYLTINALRVYPVART